MLLIKAHITRACGQADLESAFIEGYIMQVHIGDKHTDRRTRTAFVIAYFTRAYGQADLEPAFIEGYIMQVHTDEADITQAN